MTEGDRAEFGDTLAAVYALHRLDFSRAVLAIWWQALRAYDLAAVQDAFGRHAVNPDTGQFMPKPADVVRMIEGNTVDAALAAWAKVERAVAAVGTYASVVFDDPIVHRVIADMGGWPHLGKTSVDEWPFVAKEFATRYRGIKLMRVPAPYPPVLVGLFDGENSQRGHESQLPVFVGDRERARAVLAGGTNAPLLEVNRA